MKETIKTIQDRLKAGEKVLDIISQYESKARLEDFNIYREVFDDIETQSIKAQEMIDCGNQTAISGVPIAIKDNILFDRHLAGASSKMLEGYRASYDSTVVKKLKDAGAIIMGRTNMDEFAMGSSTENSAYGPTMNPIDRSRVPGGSSGGSAAAVAAGLAVAALGSDTGGSIRQPAAFCGVVGLLPTYGSVSRHGLMAMGSSLDVIGPFTATVSDNEIIYNFIKGKDKFDSTSKDSIEKKENSKKTLAIPKGLFETTGITEDIKKNFHEVVKKINEAGFITEEIDMPYFNYALSVYYILMPAEVSSNLARFDGVRYGSRKSNDSLDDLYVQTRGELFGSEVRRRILLGTYVLSHGYYDAYYNKALIIRDLIKKEFNTVFENYNAILTPTTPSTAFKIGEKVNDPLAMYLSDLFTVPANIAQIPALSIPSGKGSDGLPCAVQIMGPQFGESTLFEIGKIIEDYMR